MSYINLYILDCIILRTTRVTYILPDGPGGADAVHPFSRKTKILSKTAKYTSSGTKTVTFSEVDEILGIYSISASNNEEGIRPISISTTGNSVKFALIDGGASGININITVKVRVYV